MSNNSPITIKDLKSPKGTFLLGHLLQFNTYNKHQVLERWVEESGHLFKIHFIGKEFIVSANPNLNNKILRARPETFKRFSKIDEILKEMGINGVFNAEGMTWKRHRKPVTEALNLKNIKAYYPIISEKTENILKKFKNYVANNKQTINVQKEFMAYTIDITTEVAFGYKLNTINNNVNSFQKHLEVIFPKINSRVTAPIPIWRYFKSKSDKTLEVALKGIKTIIYDVIAQAKKRIEANPQLREHPTNFLETLLVDDTNTKLSDDEIYGNIFTMLLAGEDTTSNSLSWTLFYLAQHPEIVKKIRQEAIAIYKDESVLKNYKNSELLKYTNAVIQESLRLKPTTPQLYLESNTDTIIDNFSIPKGTCIILQNKVAQTKDDYFSEANTFIPERWLKNGCPLHNNHTPNIVRTFGGGSRYCPGMHLAKSEMVTLISTLCKHFNFKLESKPETIKERFEFTMYPENLEITFTNV